MDVLDLSKAFGMAFKGLAFIKAHNDLVFAFVVRVVNLDKDLLEFLDWHVCRTNLFLLLLLTRSCRSLLNNLLMSRRFLNCAKIFVVIFSYQVLHSLHDILELLQHFTVHFVIIMLLLQNNLGT